jgi:hypothetical protein
MLLIFARLRLNNLFHSPEPCNPVIAAKADIKSVLPLFSLHFLDPLPQPIASS